MSKARFYHYVHCPYCLRVRMAAGYLGIPYESRVLSYDDEETPIKIMGKKMLPIWEDDGAFTSNESLEIIAKLDCEKKLYSSHSEAAHEMSNKLGKPIHSLVMPHWIYSKEFSESSRKYFQQKKEVKRGPFSELVKKREQFENDLNPLLKEVEDSLKPFWKSEKISLSDIIIASHLWGLYMLPEFQFSEKLHSYLQNVKKECHFRYHEDFWSPT